MSKLYRSLLWSGFVAAGVAACGDDVTITPPAPPPAPAVHSVSVGPTGVSIKSGEQLQMIASVNADAGVATTVTWSVNVPASVASVSATGLLTTVAGAAGAQIAVQACSTVNSSVCGNATVTVTGLTPATLSIASITFGNTATPVVTTNVFGQIDVNLNLDAGSQNVAGVDVLIDGVVVASQNFSATQFQDLVAAQAAAAAAASDTSSASVVQILLSVNTAAFNPLVGAPICPGGTPSAPGAACFLNGQRLISARARLTGSTPVATPSISLTFNNQSIIAVSVSVVNGGSAHDASGILWQTGDLTATAFPVIYTAGSPVIQQVVLDVTEPGCDLDPVVLTAPPYTATWLKADDIADGGSAGCEQADLHVDATSTVGGAIGPDGDSPDLNFDNRGPGAPTFRANPNGRRNGWINPTVGLTGSNTSSTDNDWLVNGLADGGVGGYVRKLRIGDGLPGDVDAALAATASATPALPAPTLTNNTLCAVASATDLLGNESTLPDAGDPCLQILTTDPSFFTTGSSAILFGVDIDAPTIAFSGGLGSNARINTATVGAEFQVTVADIGAIGNSGMLSGAAVVGTVQRREQGVTPPSLAGCFLGSWNTPVTGICNPVSINVAPPFPLVPTTTVAASVLTGYYTASLVAQDAAGNKSAAVTRVVAHDDAVNAPALTSALFNTPLGGGTAVFNANSSDNFDLWKAVYTMTYAGGVLAATPLVFPTVTLNTFNVAPLVNSNVAAGITVTGFMRQVQDVTGNAPLAATAGFKPTNLAGVVTDQSNTPSATANTPIPGASVTPGVDYLAALAPQLINSWAISNAATLISNGAGTATPAHPTSVTLNADVFGPTATFNPPFAVVNFFIVSGGNLVQIGSAVGSSSTVDDGSPNGRRHRYTFSWTPGAAQPVGVVTIYAIGVSAAGDGLTTLANTNITITNP